MEIGGMISPEIVLLTEKVPALAFPIFTLNKSNPVHVFENRAKLELVYMKRDTKSPYCPIRARWKSF